MDVNGPVTFIESSQLCSFPQSCLRNVCVFRSYNDETGWKLGIIQNLFPSNKFPLVRLFCWIGEISCLGNASFSSPNSRTWNDVKSHFVLESHFLSDIELIFVNQIRGESIRNDPICPTTVSADDGGVQCSLFGPDIFSPDVPSAWNHGTPESFDFTSVKLERFHDMSSLPVTYVKDKSQGCAWMRICSLQSSAMSNLV